MEAASVFDVVVNPDRFFSRRLTYVDAVVPILLAAIVGIGLSYAYRPFFVEALLASLPGDVPPAALDSVVSKAFRFGGVGAAMTPIVQVGVTATLVFVMLAACGDTLPRFESLCVCAAWAALLLLGKDLARYGMLLSGGLESIGQITDLQPGVGLGFLIAEPRSVAHDALEAINGFDIGYVVVLAFAIGRSERVRFRDALGAATTAWLLLQAVRIGFGALFYR